MNAFPIGVSARLRAGAFHGMLYSEKMGTIVGRYSVRLGQATAIFSGSTPLFINWMIFKAIYSISSFGPAKVVPEISASSNRNCLLTICLP